MDFLIINTIIMLEAIARSPIFAILIEGLCVVYGVRRIAWAMSHPVEVAETNVAPPRYAGSILKGLYFSIQIVFLFSTLFFSSIGWMGIGIATIVVGMVLGIDMGIEDARSACRKRLLAATGSPAAPPQRRLRVTLILRILILILGALYIVSFISALCWQCMAESGAGIIGVPLFIIFFCASGILSVRFCKHAGLLSLLLMYIIVSFYLPLHSELREIFASRVLTRVSAAFPYIRQEIHQGQPGSYSSLLADFLGCPDERSMIRTLHVNDDERFQPFMWESSNVNDYRGFPAWTLFSESLDGTCSQASRRRFFYDIQRSRRGLPGSRMETVVQAYLSLEQPETFPTDVQITIFLLAALRDRSDLLQRLPEHGLDVTAMRNLSGLGQHSAVSAAVWLFLKRYNNERQNLDALTFLFDQYAPDIMQHSLWHQLYREALAYPEIVTLLWRYGADPSWALFWAVPSDLELAKLCLEHGADPNANLDDGWIPFLQACREGCQPEVLDLLYDAGADVNAIDTSAYAKGSTGLMTAARKAYPECVQWLLEHGARRDRVDPFGETALDKARKMLKKEENSAYYSERYTEIIRLLTTYPNDLTVKTKSPDNASMSFTTEQILRAQKRLRDLEYNPGPLDGRWGEKTREAVKQFQQDRGLAVSGELDDATRQELGL